MKLCFFILFTMFSLIYIWNGKDLFKKKEWFLFFVKIISVIVFAYLLVFILVGMSKYLHLMTKETARALTVTIPASITAILISKFFVVMLNTIFDIVLRFHARYNTASNYSKILKAFNQYGAGFQFVTKCLASFGCISMFYGIWFAIII